MKTHGFTIIELMIGVAIIGTIVSAVLSTYRWANSAQQASNGETIHRVDINSPRCVNGVLLYNNKPVVENGTVVKC